MRLPIPSWCLSTKPVPVEASFAFGVAPDLIHKLGTTHQSGEGGMAILSLILETSSNLYLAVITLISLGSQCHTIDVANFS